MKNDRFDALLRRDTATRDGLLADQAQYAPLEADIGPLRQEHAANLAQADRLSGDVLRADADDSAEVKGNAKAPLRALALRLAAALEAYAASTANSDPDLLGRVTLTSTALRRADEGNFVLLVQGLLKEADARPQELAKREFTANDLAETKRLLARFDARRTTGRQQDVAGQTARQQLAALLARNEQLVKKIRQQLRPYRNSAAKHDVWLRFQGYTKVVVRKGGGGSAGNGPAADGPK